MALTSQSSVFGRLHEDGINLFIGHIMRQRPSLFNYGTEYFLHHPDRLCQRIDVHPEVTRRGNPLITVEDPLPIPGTDGAVGMNFCLQLAEFLIDFHPGKRFELPPQLNPPLAEQHVALKIRFCAGLGCPGSRELIGIEPPERPGKQPGRDKRESDTRVTVKTLPFRELLCFCLDVYAVAHIETRTFPTGPHLEIKLDGLEIVDIQPERLENSIECYVATVLRLGVLPRAAVAVNVLILGLQSKLPLTLAPITPQLPFNPSIELDALSVFVNII